MKRFLTAAMIATALASPVRGEVVEFSCINVESHIFGCVERCKTVSLTPHRGRSNVAQAAA